MQIFRAAIAATVLIASVCAADAQPSTPSSWNGFYAGMNGGYGWNGRSSTFSPNDPASAVLFPNSPVAGVFGTPSPAADFNVKGGTLGAQIGWNWQFAPRFLAGLEADFNVGSVEGTGKSNSTLQFLTSQTPLVGATSEDLKQLGTIRGRFGFLVTDDVLLFGTGGFAYGRLQHESTFLRVSPGLLGISVDGYGYDCVNGAPCFSASKRTTETGWTAGGGAEWRLFSALRFKLEYSYVNLGAKPSYNILATIPTRPLGSSILVRNTGDFEFHFVRAGLNLAF